MRGKYSPTVNTAYMKDRTWHDKYANGEQYDPEGYDSYGYDKNDRDRAGNQEYEYYTDDYDMGEYGGGNYKYDDASNEWGFDGVRPVAIK